MRWTLVITILFIFGVAVGIGIMYLLCKDDYNLGYTHGREDAERGVPWQF